MSRLGRRGSTRIQCRPVRELRRAVTALGAHPDLPSVAVAHVREAGRVCVGTDVVPDELGIRVGEVPEGDLVRCP
jgi:hypothetical protein